MTNIEILDQFFKEIITAKFDKEVSDLVRIFKTNMFRFLNKEIFLNGSLMFSFSEDPNFGYFAYGKVFYFGMYEDRLTIAMWYRTFPEGSHLDEDYERELETEASFGDDTSSFYSDTLQDLLKEFNYEMKKPINKTSNLEVEIEGVCFETFKLRYDYRFARTI